MWFVICDSTYNSDSNCVNKQVNVILLLETIRVKQTGGLCRQFDKITSLIIRSMYYVSMSYSAIHYSLKLKVLMQQGSSVKLKHIIKEVPIFHFNVICYSPGVWRIDYFFYSPPGWRISHKRPITILYQCFWLLIGLMLVIPDNRNSIGLLTWF